MPAWWCVRVAKNAPFGQTKTHRLGDDSPGSIADHVVAGFGSVSEEGWPVHKTERIAPTVRRTTRSCSNSVSAERALRGEEHSGLAVGDTLRLPDGRRGRVEREFSLALGGEVWVLVKPNGEGARPMCYGLSELGLG